MEWVSPLLFRDTDGSALGRHREMASTIKSDFVKKHSQSHPGVFVLELSGITSRCFLKKNIRYHIPFFVKINQNWIPLFFEIIRNHIGFRKQLLGAPFLKLLETTRRCFWLNLPRTTPRGFQTSVRPKTWPQVDQDVLPRLSQDGAME